jgi:aspartyl-tRNA(Asn)/glutamyl-tRNA(Gln) amidotransferase subunit B
MQMGHMRFEPNINLHIDRDGRTYKTPIIEVKNLNSFRSLEGAVAFEIRRQYEQFQADPKGFSLEKLGKQNRGYDVDRQQTVFQRDKEEAHDYRYFPDPDLPAVVVDDAWRDRIAATIGELPLTRRQRYLEELGLTSEQADALTQDAPTGDLLDRAVADGADGPQAAKLLMSRGAALANERQCTIAEVGITAAQLAGLVKMLTAGKVNATAAASLFDALAESDEPADGLAESMGLLAVTDTGQLEQWIDEAIAANPQAVAIYQSGEKKAQKSFGFLIGQVMQASRGAAPPAEVTRLLKEKLG